MVIDIPNNPLHARVLDCLDLDTGQPLDVFYADDEVGVYRVYRLTDSGSLQVDPATGDLAWEERRGRIKVINAEESPRVRRQTTHQG